MTIDFRPIDPSRTGFAEIYDELPLWSAPFGLRLLERVPLVRGQTILDIGCGTGFLAIELAQRSGLDSTVIGVDPWTAAMARLRHKLTYLGITNVQLIETAAENLPLEDGSVDTAVSNLGINNFDDPTSALAECYRVLKPGGRLLLTTNLNGHMKEFYAIYRSVLDQCNLTRPRAALSLHEAARGTPESIEKHLIDVGFTVRSIETDTFRMRYADGTAFLRHWFIRLAFLPAWASLVEDSDRQSVFAEIERRLNDESTSNGELVLSIPMALVDAQRRLLGVPVYPGTVRPWVSRPFCWLRRL